MVEVKADNCFVSPLLSLLAPTLTWFYGQSRFLYFTIL